MRVLEVSLRKAGFTVTTAISVQDAVDKLELGTPDLIISETSFADGDGFELPRRVRATPDWVDIPFIFLTGEGSIENKIKGLELGVDDYLTKPIYIKEIVTRINILLQKRQRIRFEERKDGHTRFAGRVADMPVVDVIQTIEISRKSGVIQFVGDRGRQATIYFRDGRVIDAEAGSLQGEDAIYRLLTWSEGEFEVVFRTVRRREVITTSSQGLLMEGMRRLDEWSRLLEQLPALTHRFEVDADELASRLGDVPDDNNSILRLIDGKRTLTEVIDASDVGDLECLQAISRLFFEELVIDLDHGKSERRDTGKPMPLVEVDMPTPIEDAVSGPIPLGARMTEHETSRPAPAVTPEPEAQPEAEPEFGLIDEPSMSPTELMGSYRKSSLHKIDEAVAAAQLLEPSLFDEYDDVRPPTLRSKPMPAVTPAATPAVTPAATPAVTPAATETRKSTNGIAIARTETPVTEIDVSDAIDEDDYDYDSVPAAIEREDSPPPRRSRNRRSLPSDMPWPPLPEMEADLEAEIVAESELEPLPVRDDSGLRMIGSLGRDRAEASGELAPIGSAQHQLTQTQRELVTILPRRAPRANPAATEPPPPPPSRAKPATTPPPAPRARRPSTVPPPLPAAALRPSAPGMMPDDPTPRLPIGPIEPPEPLPPPPRSSLQGSGVARSSSGPGTGPLVLFILAALLTGVALLVWLKRPDSTPAVAVDAGVAGDNYTVDPITPDAAGAEVVVDAQVTPPPADATQVAVAIDAQAAPVRDAAVTPTIDGGVATVDRTKQAKLLMEQAHDALQEGNFTLALEHIDGSLKLRKTARGYMLRAQALQRLDRIPEALDSVDLAAEAAPTYPPVFELRGRILWAAGRKDEAKFAFEQFLALESDTPKAESIRDLIRENN